MAAIAAVGTLNPGKLAAIKLCFAEASVAYTCEAIHTESGVADQPMGLDETVLGAKNRALASRAGVPGAQLGIGLESGLVPVDGLLFDFCACAIADGERCFVGVSSMFPLPPRVAALLPTEGYNAAFERATGKPADPDGDGVLAQLSGGVLTRPRQMKESVHTALLQLQNLQLYTDTSE